MNIKNMIGIGLTTLLGYIAVANANDLKTDLILRGVATEDQKPITSAELLVRGLPVKSDFYAVKDGAKGNEYYKFRTQSVPLEYGIVGLGIAGQYVDGTKFEEHQEVGPVLRLKGKPTEKTFAKSDLRWFPERNEIDGYMFFDSPWAFADCLWKYNFEKDSGAFRPGIDAKITDNVSIGLEGKFVGRIDEMQKDYVGVRAGVRF